MCPAVQAEPGLVPQEDPPVVAGALLEAAVQCARAACLDLLAQKLTEMQDNYG